MRLKRGLKGFVSNRESTMLWKRLTDDSNVKYRLNLMRRALKFMKDSVSV